ncbi:MAG: histidine kinase [Clostridiales bacterium]|nr:histidine kinase [Clostridiales bacterium]
MMAANKTKNKIRDTLKRIDPHQRKLFLICLGATVLLVVLSMAVPPIVISGEARANERVNTSACEIAREKNIVLLRTVQRLAEEKDETFPDEPLEGCDSWAVLTPERVLQVYGSSQPALNSAVLDGMKYLMQNPTNVYFSFTNAGNASDEISCWVMALQSNTEQHYIWICSQISAVELLSVASETDCIVITDDNGIVYTNFKSAIKADALPRKGKTQTVSLGDEVYVVSRSVVNREFTIYTFREIGRLRSALRAFGSILGGLGMLLLFLEVLLEKKRLAEKEKTRQQLACVTEQCRSMELNSSITFDAGDSLAPFYQVINTMLESMQRQMEKTEELAACRRKIEIRQLQGQFNPHFVFNLLANLQYLIRIDPEKASGIVAGLSRLLRYSLQNSRSMVPLREDAENMNNYMMLQQSRYGERLDWLQDIEPELMECMIPKLLFQPLVENAIVHNIDNTEKLRISLCGHVKNGESLFVIRDNGRGIPPQDLFDLQQLLDSGEGDSDHIGLFNVHRTIQLTYGEEYGLEIDSIYNRGTAITARLPYDMGDEKNV